MGDTIELSALEYDVLWEHLRLGAFPTVLQINSHGATLAERAELTEKVWESLAERKLGWPSALDGRLRNRLRLLAQPEWELDARLYLNPNKPRTSALITANHSSAVVAVLRDNRLTLRTRPADQLAHAAVALLPPHPSGTGASITLPAENLDTAAKQAGRNPAALAQSLQYQGLGRSEAHRIADITGTVVRFGHFGAARTQPFQQRRRATHVVSVYDSTAGRYLFTRKPSAARNWVTLIPAPDAAILRQLDELLTELDRS